MKNTQTYATGETPHVGDVVQAHNSADWSYYSDFRNNKKHYTVKEIRPGIKSLLIKIEDERYQNYMKASNFNLISSLKQNEQGFTNLVFMTEDFKIVDKIKVDPLDPRMVKPTKFVKEYLRNNVGKRVYIFTATAHLSTEEPKTIWHSLNDPNISDIRV